MEAKSEKNKGKGNSKSQASQISSEPTPPYSTQRMNKPGLEQKMHEKPRWLAPDYKAAGKLKGKKALITGGDSGIGRAVAYLYAREGADVGLSFLQEEMTDAKTICQAIEKIGQKAYLFPGDLSSRSACDELVDSAIEKLGALDILVVNAAYQRSRDKITEISDEQWRETMAVNMDAYFYLTRRALPHLKDGASIIATASVVGVRGSESLLDYGASKGAMIAFSKCLAKQLAPKGIRVNVVAPGPVWTPLNPADSGADDQKIKSFGSSTPYGRAAQPEEVAPAYVFFASDADSSYVSGMLLGETGAEIIGS